MLTSLCCAIYTLVSTFVRFLQRGSIAALKAELDAGIRVPRRVDGAGRVMDGVSYGKKYFRRILKSPLYRLELQLTGEEGSVIVHPWSATPSRRGRDMILPPGNTQTRPMKAEDRARILKAIATGRAWMDEPVTSTMSNPSAIASRETLTERTVRMTLSLAHLAPRIARAIIDGRLPRGIGIRDLADLPPIWAEQERALGM